MTIEEFVSRTRYNPSDLEFAEITKAYVKSDLLKDDFCRRWKLYNAPYPIELSYEVVEVRGVVCVYIEDDTDEDGIFVKGFATDDDAHHAVKMIQAGCTDCDFNGEFKTITSTLAAIRLYEKIWS